jgi:hypothetical protein
MSRAATRPDGRPSTATLFQGWGRKVGPVFWPQDEKPAPANGLPEGVFEFSAKGVGPGGAAF